MPKVNHKKLCLWKLVYHVIPCYKNTNYKKAGTCNRGKQDLNIKRALFIKKGKNVICSKHTQIKYRSVQAHTIIIL